MKQDDIEILDHQLAYHGFFKLERYRLRHRLFNGNWSPPLVRELFERGHAAAVLPYDPVRDEIILIEQFRIGAIHTTESAWLIEIVAGIIEPGETAEDVIRREAIEESGCPIQQLEPICEYYVSPGGTSERLSLYCGQVDAIQAGGIHGCSAEGEDIRVFTVSFTDALTMVSDGRINSASPIIALLWLAQNRDRLRIGWQ
jgi:ADP-ribose pyrophosphatase